MLTSSHARRCRHLVVFIPDDSALRSQLISNRDHRHRRENMTIDYVQYANDVDAGVADVFKAAPGPMRAYAQLVAEATKDGALDAKVKELMAVAISISGLSNSSIGFAKSE